MYDVIVVGAGPAGSACAAFCARAGLTTLLLERSVFPREKVCGDCLNPGCWPILDRLEVSGEVLRQPHSRLGSVEFVGLRGNHLRYKINPSAWGEIAIKRSLLDHVLLRRASQWGVDVRQGVTVESVGKGWKVITREEGVFEGAILVAADGRNSTVARLAGLLPASSAERIAVQTHLRAPAKPGNPVTLRLLRHGYCGSSAVGDGELNVCLVSKASDIGRMKVWAAEAFPLAPAQEWRTIAPLSRGPAPCSPGDGLLLVGDAARVVEPFTGEGIYYALASGELAAASIVRNQGRKGSDFADYRRAHEKLYAGRLWINRLARQAVLHPRLADFALGLLGRRLGLLGFLTRRVLGEGVAD